MDGLDLSCLTEEERQHIIQVLRRDIELKQNHERKLQKLKREISEGTAVADLRTPPGNNRTCERCCKELGVVFGKGRSCAKCCRRICDECSVELDKVQFICTVCQKEWEYTCASGQWFFKTRELTVPADENRRVSDEYRPKAKTSVASSAPFSEKLLQQLQEPATSIPKGSFLGVNDSNDTDPALRRRRSKGWIQASNFVHAMQAMKPRHSFRKPHSLGRNCDVRSSSSENEGHDDCLSGMANISVTKVASAKTSFRKSFIEGSPSKKPGAKCSSLSLRDASSRSDQSSSELDNGEPTSGFRKHKFATMRLPLRNVASEKLDKQTASCSSRHGKISVPDRLDSNKLSASFLSAGNLGSKSGTDDLRATSTAANETGFSCALASVSMELPHPNRNAASDLAFEATQEELHCNVLRTPSFVSLQSGFSSHDVEYMSEVSGDVVLRLDYDVHRATLEVFVIECHNLTAGFKGIPNAYVKTYLLPDTSDHAKRKTKVKWNCSDPVFNQTLKYDGLTRSELEMRSLLVSLWHSDPIGKNIHLGEACVNLCDYPWHNNQSVSYTLVPKDPSVENIVSSLSGVSVGLSGESTLLLSVKFCPNQTRNCLLTLGTLYCLIRSCRSLFSPKFGTCLNALVKGVLYPLTSKKALKQKTAVVKRSNDPVWNHTFMFEDIALEHLRNKSLELLVLSKEMFGSTLCLGGVRLNLGSGMCDERRVEWMDASEQEAKIWKSVIERPNAWVEATLRLRTDIKSRTQTS